MKIAKKILVGVLTLAVLVSCFALFAYAEDPHFDYDAPYAEGTYSSVLEYYEQNFGIDFDIDGVAVDADYPDAEAKLVQTGGLIKVAEEGGNKYVALSGPQGNANMFANVFLKWTSEQALNGVMLDFDISAATVELPGGITVKCGGGRTACKKSFVYSEEEFKTLYPQYADSTPIVGDSLGTCTACNKGTATINAISDSIYQYPTAHVMLSAEEETSASAAAATGYDLLVFDSVNGALKYGTVENGEFKYVTVAKTDFEYDDSAWYHVVLNYNAVTGKYGFTVTNKADATNKYTAADISAPMKAVRTFKVGSFGALHENNDTTVKVDNVKVQGGTFDRIGDDVQAVSDGYVVHFGNDVNIVALEAKSLIIDVYSRMLAGGYAPASAEAVAATRNIVLAALGTAESYVDLIDPTASYADRLKTYESYITFTRVLPDGDNLDGYDATAAAKIAAVRAACDAEYSALTTIREDSQFIAAELVGFDSASTDYAYLSPLYNAVKDRKYDSTVPGAADVKENFEILTTVFPVEMGKAESFVANVLAAEPDDGVAFGVSYGAFVKAREGYFNNSTYPNMADEGTEEGALSAFARLEEHYEPYERHNESYIYQIYSAGIGNYINSIKYQLAGAYALTLPEAGAPEEQEYHSLFKTDYPGVAEAMEQYAELKKAVDDKEAAANAYINSVTALEGLEGEALINAIKAAEELQKTGNITGVAGVELANIYLNNVKTELGLKTGYSDKFVKLVAALADAKTLSERYALITEALAIDEIYLGADSEVTAAKTALNSAIAAYNAEIAKINAVLAGAAQ